MFDKNTKGYVSLANDESETIEGYRKPTQVGVYSKNCIIYFDDLNQETKITEKHLPTFLKALRASGDKAYPYLSLFYKNGKTMEGQEQFEIDLEKSPALMDYWLLRLVDLTQRAGTEKLYLTELYKKLDEKLNEFEQKINKLNINASRRQNKERELLVENFKKEWDTIIQPAIKKYESQLDIRNILLNIAAAITIVGILWLSAKNIAYYAQGKNNKLGLFQFEQAHSKKIDHLKHLSTSALPQVPALSNYFTNDIADSKATHQELSELIQTLDTEVKSLP
ncbi:MAG TPA: hypothetical protein VHD33_00570, partial [Legionellaceae bacterium]|nr:hypothetical protein [Legionellaceae bacterium]